MLASLDLYGGVRYAVLAQVVLDGVDNLLRICDIIHYDMGCESRLSGADGPDMDVMDLENSLCLKHFLLNLLLVDTLRYGID